MSTVMGVTRGRFGMVVADTRISNVARGPFDSGDYVLRTPRGEDVLLATDRQRKLWLARGPRWLCGGGNDIVPVWVGLKVLAQTPGRDLINASACVEAIPDMTAQVLKSWGFSVAPGYGDGLDCSFLMLRTNPNGAELLTASLGNPRWQGGPGECWIAPPVGLSQEAALDLAIPHFTKSAQAPHTWFGHVVLAAAAVLEEMGRAAPVVGPRASAGLLLQAPGGRSASVCRVDFDCEQLLEHWTPARLHARIMDELMGDWPHDQVAEPIMLT